MARLEFFVLWSLRDAPRQFSSKSNRRCFQVHVPLPLPRQLVVFGLGEWTSGGAAISVEVVVSEEVKPQKIGTLTFQTRPTPCDSEYRCLTWEGDWDSDVVAVSAEKGRKGMYGKILLTVCGKEEDSFVSSTPLVPKKRLFLENHHGADLSHSSHQSAESEKISPNSSHLGDSVCSAELQADKTEMNDSAFESKYHISSKGVNPKRRVFAIKRGQTTWSSEEMESLHDQLDRAPSPKKRMLLGTISQEKNTAPLRRELCPSKRWKHTMCLSDPDTALVIGGETSDQSCCKDTLWKLEIENDFWFPMGSSTSGPVPPCAYGHTATYDPDSKAIFLYGGLREGQCCSDLYILNTVTWTWKLVAAKGNVPTLTYHTATFYKKELFIFGGVQPNRLSGSKACSNSLYIFNPEFELWYQPIVEGDRPLPRFGHSSTLLSDKLLIFGGRNTAAYLNDVHILDLGFMEYTAVKCENMPPLPRGFHASLPVAGNRVLISGGCSTVGALQDVHIFNMDTSMWSTVVSPLLCCKPRAGHTIVRLDRPLIEKHQHCVNTQYTLLVFGGSDSLGTLYNDTVKCLVEIPADNLRP